MNKQDFLKTQTCVLKLNIDCDGCKAKVKKLLQKIDGVYTVNIDTEQGKVTVTGNVDPSVLIKKLEKRGKYAQLWGPSKGSSFHQNSNQFMTLNNQFKNLHYDGAKMGKDNNNFNNNSKSQKGGGKEQQKGGGAQQQQHHQLPQQHHQLLQQHQQLLQQQMKGGMGKDFKMPTNKKDQKSVKFNLPENQFDDDEFDDDELDDEFDDEYDDEYDEMEGHDMYGGGHGHHPQSKNIPIMANGKGDNKKGKGGGGGEKKSQGGSGGAKKAGGGGGGMVGLFKGMLGVGGGKNNGKKGKDGKKVGKNGGGSNKRGGDHILGTVAGGKNGGGGGHGGKMGKSHAGGNINQKGNISNNGGGNNNNKGKGGKKGGDGGSVGDYVENDGINHGKNGGQRNIPMMGHPMSHNMLAAQPMMNGGGAYYPGMGPPPGGPYGNNPQQQQQQYMAMMMNQQRMNGGDGYGMMQQQQPHPMMYGRPQMGMPYGAPMVPPPGYHDPLTAYFSDENTNSCAIM